MPNSEFSGAVFGNQYEIQDLVDDNGIVLTYRAFQKNLKRDVAIQLIDPRYRSHPYWPTALVRGAEIAAQYAHPNIVPIIDLGVHEDINFVVLRLLEGGTLAHRLMQGPLEILEAINVVKQIGASLEFVHSQGSCHGDPATVNIAFDNWGNSFIRDFYLLGFLQVTNSNVVAGVPAFMAPERMGGNPPNPFTDQYALAAVSYSMLTAKNPWDLPTLPRIPETIVLPQVHRPEIPVAVNDVLFRALAKDPLERFPTVMEFARQFEQALRDTPQHIFISHSHSDGEYVRQLREHLQENGLQVWVDDRIEHGDQWFSVINDAIQSGAAFLVVMSPEAEKSEWVTKEILLAKRYQRPIFPLLLRGTEFPVLIDLQFADVRNGAMPDANFHRRVARAVYGV